MTEQLLTHLSVTAPILLFTYKRVDTLQRTVASLATNILSAQSDLIIFSDGAKKEEDEEAVERVRLYLRTISGFRTIKINEAVTNKGLSRSIIEGVTDVINRYGKVIVVEDDLVLAKNFLSYMNQALDCYEKEKKIFSIAGYDYGVNQDLSEDVFFIKRASSWGWATWADRWQNIDWDVKDYDQFAKSREKQQQFNEMGSDLSGMLKKQMQGKSDSWAIRWVYHQFKQNLLTVYPTQSKVRNEGFGKTATHSSESNQSRFYTELDASAKTTFRFPRTLAIDQEILKIVKEHHSVKTRVIYKIKDLLGI